VRVVASPRSGSAFPIGTTTVLATAVDASGNLAQGTFTVTVTDARPPVIQSPADLVVPPDPGTMGRVVYFNVTATDNRPGVRVRSTPESGSIFPLGDTGVICMATDAAGNTAVCAFMVTVADLEAPAILCPTNLIVRADQGQCGARVDYQVSMDELMPNASLVTLPPPGSVFPMGVSTVSCIATDAAGNTATKSFTITVVDAENPIVDLPADMTLDAVPGETNCVVNYELNASDNCSGVNLISWPPSGSRFPIGTSTVLALASDGSGNTTLATFNVTVRSPEIQPPVISRIVPSRRLLRPANGRMLPVALRVASVGKSARIVSRRILAVTCNEAEPAFDQGPPDWAIAGPMRLWLRAECHIPINDRIYTIIVECKDAAGNVTAGTTTVRVPHRGG
jgi:hypothetical protein